MNEKTQRSFDLYLQIVSLRNELWDLESTLTLTEFQGLFYMLRCHDEHTAWHERAKNLFDQWTREQNAAGRLESEITFHNLVCESGFWEPLSKSPGSTGVEVADDDVSY
jgi:hypothetical protein